MLSRHDPRRRPSARNTLGFDAMEGVALAATRVVKAGNPIQIEAATEIMKDARRRLYQVVAAD